MFKQENDTYACPTSITADIDAKYLEKWLRKTIEHFFGKQLPYIHIFQHYYYQVLYINQINQDVIPNSVRFIKED